MSDVSPIMKWLDELARYFENRDTGGEDRAHWANVYNSENALKVKAALVASEAEVERLKTALDERCLFSNPDFLLEIADEIDCGASCENIWREYDTNASDCRKSENGDYCPNDLAETLRAVAKVAREALTGEKP